MASRFKVNPALRRGFDTARVGERPMTKSGTMSKIFLMLALVTAAGRRKLVLPRREPSVLIPCINRWIRHRSDSCPDHHLQT
ncbi:hypothetical protein OVA29_13585 [Exiguobacterium sp. SL14]|nr:hypothetical protein [Exiguobacterium sp. SL14]MCY1691588.1 hypothetical protein [Exiguobacterium sp. SL14]